MTIPCEQAPTIQEVKSALNRTEAKIDKLHDAMTAVAVQNEQIRVLRQDVNELYDRVRGIEAAPAKKLEKMAWLLVGGIGSVLVVLLTKFIDN